MSRNHEAPVDHTIDVVRKVYASSFMKDINPGKLLLKYFNVKSMTIPIRQKHA